MAAQLADAARGLHSLGGADAPAGLVSDLKTLAELPAAVRDDYWALLEPNLGALVGEAADAEVAAFCQRYRVPPDELVPSVRAARLLFRTAAQRDVGVAEMAGDLAFVLEGDTATARMLLGCYGRALPRIRLELLIASIGEFGAVLDDVAVRLDRAAVSRHTPELQLPIPLLTLRYHEGSEERRVTLQLPPVALAKLRRALDGLQE